MNCKSGYLVCDSAISACGHASMSGMVLKAVFGCFARRLLKARNCGLKCRPPREVLY